MQAAGATQAMGVLRLNQGEATVQSTYGGSPNTTLSFTGVNAAGTAATAFNRNTGTAANFVADGTTGSNRITLGVTNTAGTRLDRAAFFNGNNWATIDATGFVRGLQGTDGNVVTATAGTNTIANGTGNHTYMSGNVTGQTTVSIAGLNMGAFSLGLAAGQTFTSTSYISSGDSAATISGGTLASNSEMVFRVDQATDNLAISSNFSAAASGHLIKSGAGTLMLSGTNAVNASARQYIDAGTVSYSQRVSLYNATTTSWTTGNIRVHSGGTFAMNVGGGGEFTGADVTLLLGNFAANATADQGLYAGSSLGFDTTNASGGTFTMADVIANSPTATGGTIGMTKLGTGTLVLTNANIYPGPTNVNAGTLLVASGGAGSLGNTAVAVNTGGTLGGTGTIAGAVTVDGGGTLAPGASPGVLTASNAGTALTLASGSNSVFEIGGTTRGTDYDGVTLGDGTTNGALVYGGTLSVNLTAAVGDGTMFGLFRFGDGQTGDLSTVTITGSGYGPTMALSGQLWTGVDAFHNYSFDETSGDLSVSAVPEPTSLAFLSFGLIGLVARCRRKA